MVRPELGNMTMDYIDIVTCYDVQILILSMAL